MYQFNFNYAKVKTTRYKEFPAPFHGQKCCASSSFFFPTTHTLHYKLSEVKRVKCGIFAFFEGEHIVLLFLSDIQNIAYIARP